MRTNFAGVELYASIKQSYGIESFSRDIDAKSCSDTLQATRVYRKNGSTAKVSQILQIQLLGFPSIDDVFEI